MLDAAVVVISPRPALGVVLTIDCSEISADEKLALASQISDALEGRALALTKSDSIVLDMLTDEEVDLGTLQAIVDDFVSRRSDSKYYSVDASDETIVIHSADPIAASRRKTENTLPPNLRQCPFCAFITQYEEEYIVHYRSHLFGV
ncbi:MAG: hypothetical protein ABSG45_00900 [Nitrososphaerales archaeon]|jgi:hypothetical protein